MPEPLGAHLGCLSQPRALDDGWRIDGVSIRLPGAPDWRYLQVTDTDPKTTCAPAEPGVPSSS